MMHATSCSNVDLKPSSASSKSAAFGQGRTAVLMRRIAKPMSNGFVSFIVLSNGERQSPLYTLQYHRESEVFAEHPEGLDFDISKVRRLWTPNRFFSFRDNSILGVLGLRILRLLCYIRCVFATLNENYGIIIRGQD